METIGSKTLIVLVGPPGCGKSALAWDLVARGVLRITGDDLFFAITDRNHESWRPYGVMDAVNTAMDVLMVELLKRGLPVVVDRTHLSARSRRRPLDLGHEMGYRVEAWVWGNVAEARRRNASRTGRDKVPQQNWDQMVSSFGFPEDTEGFDLVRIIEPPDAEFFRMQPPPSLLPPAQAPGGIHPSGKLIP